MSLARKIILRLMLTTLVGTAVAYGWLYLKASHVQSYLEQRALVQQAREIADFVGVSGDGSLTLTLPPRLSEAYNSIDSSYRYAVRDEAGRIVAASSRGIGPLPLRTAKERRVYEQGSGESHVIGAAIETAYGQRNFTTQVEEIGSRLPSINAAVLNEFIADGGWFIIVFLLVQLGISVATVRRGLQPLEKLSALAGRINPGNSNIRLPESGVPQEILPLVAAVNSALDRLDEGMQQQREFTANAAHQLRTPLTVLAAHIDMMSDKSVATKLRYDVDLMSRIVTQLLLVARLENLNISVDDQVELNAMVREAAANLGALAIANHKTLEVDEPATPVYVRGNTGVVIAAVSNLIENALNHSPPGGAVKIRVTPNPSIEVLDSGPGVPEHLRERVFERFWRGEASREGAGLGLAIVRRIMRALRGDVSVSDAPGGGAKFSLDFPVFSAEA
ncbi:MAG TPA: HAMP domain-containing sensor histidine kinase [Xanthobacteraceae bacterium]|nr:HAMP domain-containing sensor histidine kinase [Xanthobacteraceae bacterium]